jgi:hypothetical protein
MVWAGLSAAETPAKTTVDFRSPPHSYLEHRPRDRMTRLLEAMAAGKVRIDTSSPHAHLKGMLEALEIPQSSQLLVFSASSLQSEIINPRNPRALYFNEDTYLGYVPGGKLEVISMDPTHGAIFHLFEGLQIGGAPPAVSRSTKCFNCHAGHATGRIPGLIAESLLPMPSGASLETYRRDEQGHQIPLSNRFGGWHLTGDHHLRSHHANLVGLPQDSGKWELQSARPGEQWDLGKHLLPTSDVLPHLIHEHQLGFENRAFRAAYLMRQWLHDGAGKIPATARAEFDEMALAMARYILFADEATLPAEGIIGDGSYREEFLKRRKPARDGRSLRDLDLRKAIFKHRASFMLHTESWLELPKSFKDAVYYRMAEGLRPSSPAAQGAHLPVAERLAIRSILKDTQPDLPPWWR